MGGAEVQGVEKCSNMLYEILKTIAEKPNKTALRQLS